MKSKYSKIYGRTGVWEDFLCEPRNLVETQFRNCKATVGTTLSGEYTYLRSYDTVVCVIDNVTGDAVDVLRTEYGYTATSASHISKFLHDHAHKTLFRTGIDSIGSYYRRIY